MNESLPPLSFVNERFHVHAFLITLLLILFFCVFRYGNLLVELGSYEIQQMMAI
jgi:hypothetical protein